MTRLTVGDEISDEIRGDLWIALAVMMEKALKLRKALEKL
jgi:hypothetical protein